MKKLCFASVFNILVLAAKEGLGQVKIFTAVCESIGEERGRYYEDGTISKIKNGSREFPNDYKKAIISKDYESLKSGIDNCVIPLLRESLFEEIGLTIRDILLSDESIPDEIPLCPTNKSSKKGNMVRDLDLSTLLCTTLYYSIVSTKNSIYTTSGTDKITSLISKKDFLEKYPNLKEQRKQDPNNHGIIDTYLNVNDINYRSLINSSKNIDIIHIHGMTWTNKVREYLVEKLREEATTIRVILLSPDSEFFEPYAHFIGRSKPYLIDKLDDVLSIWERNYCEATDNRTKPAGNLFVYLGQFFPSKSLYRFNNTIIVNPSSMTKNKTAYLPTILCQVIDEPNESFFSTYLKEINWLAENSICIDAAEKSITRSNFSKAKNF